MEQLSPSLRTRIYVIAGLGAAGIVLDIVMNASLLDLQPAPPRLPLLAACLALNLALLLLAARLLEQASEEKTVGPTGASSRWLWCSSWWCTPFSWPPFWAFSPTRGSCPPWRKGC